MSGHKDVADLQRLLQLCERNEIHPEAATHALAAAPAQRRKTERQQGPVPVQMWQG
jgi:hypothetical protein